MKVYIVTEGCYSDYNIDSVFTDKKQAELRVAVLNKNGYDCPMISEWETDTIHLEGEAVKCFRIQYWIDNGDIQFTEGDFLITKSSLSIVPIVSLTRRETNYFYVEADSEEKAEKIFHDKFNQALYEAYMEKANAIKEGLR